MEDAGAPKVVDGSLTHFEGSCDEWVMDVSKEMGVARDVNGRVEKGRGCRPQREEVECNSIVEGLEGKVPNFCGS